MSNSFLSNITQIALLLSVLALIHTVINIVKEEFYIFPKRFISNNIAHLASKILN